MSIEGQCHFFTIYFQVLYVLCFTRPRYQVSVYRIIGPLFCFYFTVNLFSLFNQCAMHVYEANTTSRRYSPVWGRVWSTSGIFKTKSLNFLKNNTSFVSLHKNTRPFIWTKSCAVLHGQIIKNLYVHNLGINRKHSSSEILLILLAILRNSN